MKISVFIAVYNGETYLRQTLDSLLNQSFSDFEVLCVDDSSKDNSYNILLEYQEKDVRFKAIRKENGGDVPHSWVYIFPMLLGEFTIYLSQDDFLEYDALARLVQRQIETGADAVVPSVYFYENKKKDFRIDRGVNGDLSLVLKGRDAYELALDYTIPGFAIWRTEIIRREGMLLDAFNADELAQRIWFLKCDTVAFSDAKFFYRQDNPNAVTKKLSIVHYSSIVTNMHLLDSMIEQGISGTIVNSFRRKYFKSLFYLTACLKKYKKEYRIEDVIRTRKIIENCFYHICGIGGICKPIRFLLLKVFDFLTNVYKYFAL